MSRDRHFKPAEQQKRPGERGTGFVTRWPFFYGWVVMAAGTFGIIMTSPG